MFQVTDKDGSRLDARLSVDGTDVILHSRGGAKGRRGAVNADYAKALLLLISRLSDAAIPILGAWVDSATVQPLPLSARSILSESDGGLSPERICSLLSSRMRDIRDVPNPSAKGGNSTKRIRIATGFGGASVDLATRLGAVLVEEEALPAEVLRRATPEYIWRAVQQFIEGDVQHPFDLSTDWDLIADEGRRLPSAHQ